MKPLIFGLNMLVMGIVVVMAFMLNITNAQEAAITVPGILMIIVDSFALFFSDEL
jgi:hypothetical protein